jgi:type III secretion protein L
MSKKCFTLIHGDRIHLAPKTKVVAADAFSKMITAEEMLHEVRLDAEKYVKETAQECEKLKEFAQKTGFDEGLKEWTDHIAKLEEEIANVRKELQKIIVPIALTAAKKIVGREIALSEQTVVDIVANNLKAVSQHRKIKIYVNRKDLAALEANKPRLKQIFEGLESLSIVERADVAPGGSIIETEAGIINAQLDNQWRALERAFDSLIKKGQSIK